MNNSFFTLGSRILLAVLFYLSSGCVSTAHRPDPDASVVEVPADSVSDINVLIKPSESYTDSSELFSSMVRHKFVAAEKACTDSAYTAADSLFREILPGLIGVSDEDTVSDAMLSEIVNRYSFRMPDSIAVPDEIAQQVFQQQMLLSLDTLSFTGEDSALIARLAHRSGISYDVPMVWNRRVEKALHYYITRNRITVEHWKKRAGRYLPFMKKMFADSGLPQDLAYLPLIESGFNPKAYSRAHASGIWQFIRSTGKVYGMRNNYWLDERRDPVKSTGAAIRYLKKLYGDFNDWHLALAAYNCGEGGLGRAIKRAGVSDYWQLRLPKETMNYVPFFLAALTIAKEPEFIAATANDSQVIPFDSVLINDCVDMKDIAEGISVAPDSLRKLNPHILHWCTPPDMANVPLYLPSGKSEEFYLFYTTLPPEKKVRWYRYRVQPGDNLGSIARRFKLPIAGIRSVNRLSGTRIIAGKHLFLPIPLGNERYRELAVQEEKKIKAGKKVAAAVPEGAKLVVYEVKSGDSIWRLAEIFGVTGKQIRAWNKLTNNRIKAGQILSIYTFTAVAEVQSAEVPTGGRKKKQEAVSVTKGIMTYTVSPGDTYYHIASMHKMDLADFYALNNINPDNQKLHPGDVLKVKENVMPDYAPRAVTRQSSSSFFKYVVSPGDNLYRIAQNFSLTVDEICQINGIIPRTLLGIGDTLRLPQKSVSRSSEKKAPEQYAGFYRVKNGDNMWRISKTIGIPVRHLYEYNGLSVNAVLMPGDTIRFPRKDEL